ncbi:hypothetical protein GGI26_001154 [Coemansia sp. RSA 1358]|nr:hypothetical protein EDC05_000984 [Coemansia umbellata]KAJ2624738.1 hypothetical protein GGI26_001154 [Coemansia sp. RSA 1358]
MERAPSRAKATNILRPTSRAQGPPFGSNDALPVATTAGVGNISAATIGTQQQQQQARVFAGGARFIAPTTGVATGVIGNPQGTPNVLRRPPSSSQFLNQQFEQTHNLGFSAVDQQQQQQLAGNSTGGMIKQRVNSYYEGVPAADLSAVPRSISRSGSRAELVPGSGMQQQQQQNQQLPPRSSSRAGRLNVGGGPMWAGPIGQIGMNGLFGGGFGSMGGDFMPASPMTPQYQQMQMQMQMQMQPPAFIQPAGGRPGSSLQVSQPARPASSAGFRSPSTDSDGQVVVNVARGGARVIGPMRGKAVPPVDGPSFLNPIPQSPSSTLGAMIPVAGGAGGNTGNGVARSALSNSSIGSGRSRSNSALPPNEEFMEAAEARVSRKMQDLEISNTSLMAVNTQLEARVKAQREQINELKKQLQLKAPLLSDSLADGELSDEALRSALKEDKVFERLISNLEHLIQDAKDALEYRSTIAAGKVISATELNEDGSQLTVGKEPGNEPDQHEKSEDKSDADTNDDTSDKSDNEKDANVVAEQASVDGDGNENENADEQSQNAEKNTSVEGKGGDAAASLSAADHTDEKLQEARELVARLMVLALASSDSAVQGKPASRIPKRSGSAAALSTPNRPASALRGGLRTPVKITSTRISSFGVASENTPVRSLVTSPTPSLNPTSSDGKEPSPQSAEKDQILEICRKLQQIL